MAQKITIKNDGVYVDDVKVPSVIGAEIKNINPGVEGAMEVALIFPVYEIDVQYKLWCGAPNPWAERLIKEMQENRLPCDNGS